MARFALFAIFLCAHAMLNPEKRTTDDTFFDPAKGNGSWLTNGGTPMNVVISTQSSPDVLTDSGFRDFAYSLGYSTECAGGQVEVVQTANLGDGHGDVSPSLMFLNRQQPLGCVKGDLNGIHFSVYRQDGPDHPTGALFLTVSKSIGEAELQRRVIAPNGFNAGRDELVQATLNDPFYGNIMYDVVAQNLTRYIKPGSQGIEYGIATDGVVKLLTVTSRQIER